MKIAIVTGASSGIGREFVRQIDATETLDEIWVIARRAERLEELKSAIKTPIRCISLDLSDESSDESLSYMLSDDSPDVRILVNAAGYGKFGAFEDLSLPEQEGMIRLNVQALTKITYRVLPYMNSGSKMYQVASMSGFMPLPYISVYAATKAYVVSYSRALDTELSRRDIRVMAVCPGWTRTEFFDRAVEHDGVIVYYNKFYTPEQVVGRALKDMKKGKTVSLCGFSVKKLVFFMKIIPHRIGMWIWCKQQKKC